MWRLILSNHSSEDTSFVGEQLNAELGNNI